MTENQTDKWRTRSNGRIDWQTDEGIDGLSGRMDGRTNGTKDPVLIWGHKITLKIQHQSVNISNNRLKIINVNCCRESEANKAKYAKQMAEQKKDAESSVRFYNQTCSNFDKCMLCTCLCPFIIYRFSQG